MDCEARQKGANIDPGADGTVTITMDPEVSGGSNLAYLSALRLEEGATQPLPVSTLILEQDFDALTAGTSDHASGGGTDWGFQTTSGDTNGNVQADNPLSAPNALPLYGQRRRHWACGTGV